MRSSSIFRGVVIAGLAMAVGVLSACGAYEPGASSSAGATPSPNVSTITPAQPASPSPIETNAPQAGDVTLPASCTSIYSAAMLASLNASIAPMNDSAVTMFSTQIVPALEVLQSGIPTLRCTWGGPSEKGIATNVSIVSSSQASTVQQALESNGFACAAADGGTVCSIETKSVTQQDQIVANGEEHLLRGNAWISTRWITTFPAGYTADIAATLWQ
jgi:hypothetical protein